MVSDLPIAREPSSQGSARNSLRSVPDIRPLYKQSGLRSGTVPVPLCVRMGAAVDILAATEAEEKRAQLCRRRDTFIEMLKRLPWPIALNGPQGQARHPGNANIRFAEFSAEDILSALQPHLGHSRAVARSEGYRLEW